VYKNIGKSRTKQGEQL